MIFVKKLVCIALVAAPVLSAPLERRDRHYICQNTHGNFKISHNKAEGNIHAAPLSNKATLSSYPHEFTNRDRFVWANRRCNKLPEYHKLLEFPVFPDGALYNVNSHHPKDNPGPARAIFTYPGKDFCGVIAHEDGNMGNLVMCH